MTRPLITFAVFGYNQERFIREAIEGAFAQTYEPLEIILSDDCSTDRTFEIMQEMADSYTGANSVRVRRNEVNRGTGEHVNRVIAAAKAELIVPSAGDDVSLPHRVERVVEHWLEYGRPVGCIFAGAFETDIQLRPFEVSTPAPWSLATFRKLILGECESGVGCAPAWPRSLFEKFGPLSEGIVNEDGALAFRGALADGLFTIDEPLVLHRHHSENIGSTGISWLNSYQGIDDYWRLHTTRRQALVRGMLADLETLEPGKHDPKLIAELCALCREVESQCCEIRDALERPFFERKIRLLKVLCRSRHRATRRTIFRHLIVPSIWLSARKWRRNGKQLASTTGSDLR